FFLSSRRRHTRFSRDWSSDVCSSDLPEEIDKLLGDIQHRLFDLGGELCIPDHRVLIPEHVSALDDALDHYNGRLSKLEEFILPRSEERRVGKEGRSRWGPM